jgi:cell division protein ZapA
MAPKNESKVLIGGNVYTLSGNESEEYLQHVALYMNKKMDEVRYSENGKNLNTRLQSVLLAINIADDYFKIRTQIEEKDVHCMELQKEIERLNGIIKDTETSVLEKQSRIGHLENEINHYKKELDEYIQLFEQGNS